MAEEVLMYVNEQAAQDYAKSHADPVVREVLWTAYSVCVFKMGRFAEPAVKPVDLLFCFQMLATLLEDRDRLSRVLAGDLTAD